jgi:hypothetical protein
MAPFAYMIGTERLKGTATSGLLGAALVGAALREPGEEIEIGRSPSYASSGSSAPASAR